MDPTFPLVPFINFLACCLILGAISGSIFRAWNIGVCLYALWTFLVCFTIGVNTIIWSNNTHNVAPVWCDFTTHIAIGSQAAIPACTFIISRRLFKISRLRVVSTLDASRREIIFDLALGCGLPILVMGLYYIVQEPRFVIVEDFGCASATASAAAGLSLLLIQSWSILLPATSILLYGIRIIRTFNRQRKAINEFLESGSSVGRSTYLRVMILGSLDMVITLPVNVVNVLATVLQGPIPFWGGWDAVHARWKPITLSRGRWTSEPLVFFGVIWMEWMNAVFAILFFVLFGLTSENRARYRRAFWWIVKPFGFRPCEEKSQVSNIVFTTVIANPGQATDSLAISSHSPGSEIKTTGSAIAISLADAGVYSSVESIERQEFDRSHRHGTRQKPAVDVPLDVDHSGWI